MTAPAVDVARVELAPGSPDSLGADLGDLPGVVGRDGVDGRWTTTWWDTPDLRLTRAGAALCRTDGDPPGDGAGPAPGWELRLPGLAAASPAPEASGDDGDGDDHSDHERSRPSGDVTVPLGAGDEPPPSRLAELARALVRGGPLRPVATVRSRRRTHRLLDAGGSPLAELQDDEVEAEGALGPSQRRRLLTVRGPDEPDLRHAVAERLGTLGATPTDADWPSPDEAARLALGPAAGAEPDVPRPPASIDRHGPAGELVTADLRAHVGALLAWEAPVQLDRHDAVHKMRVSVRRLRSSLRTFGPLLDPAAVARLEPELSWLAASLGGPRDAEVLRDRLTGVLDGLPASLRRGGFDGHLAAALDDAHHLARARLLADLETPRYRQLLVDVVALAARPPLLAEAGRPVDEVVPELLRRAWHKLARRVKQAQRAEATATAAAVDSGGPPADDTTPDEAAADGVEEDEAEAADEALHRARKAAKQLRYAAEACIPAYGRRAERLAAEAEATQEVLGEHQDSVVSQQRLVELAGQATRRGEDTFTYGVLVGEERRRADHARRAFDPVWKETSRRRYRRWLSG